MNLGSTIISFGVIRVLIFFFFFKFPDFLPIKVIKKSLHFIQNVACFFSISYKNVILYYLILKKYLLTNCEAISYSPSNRKVSF